MINIQNDLLPLSPTVLNKMSRSNLERIAVEGTKEQKDCLIDWAYSGLPAWFFEDLFFLATGTEWSQD
jgi:hypothetical protein